MSSDEAAREVTDIRKTLERLDAVVADQADLIGYLQSRVRMLEKDAMRRGSQVVTLRMIKGVGLPQLDD